MEKLLPPLTHSSRPFYEGCNQNELRLQYCAKCKIYQFYPRIICNSCGDDSISWIRASGRATLLGFTVVRRSLTEAYEAPYTVILALLEEGPTMMSQLIGEPGSCSIGDSLSVEFVEWGAELKLPLFRKVEE